ncbi:MAG: aminotransferase class IV, partial [Bradyrhizobium sp.]
MSEIVSINGAFLEAEAICIDPSDRGFTVGDGVFDTMLAIDGQPVDADAHFERLARHAKILHIPVDTTPLPDIAAALLQKNNVLQGRIAIRTTLTRGPGPRGLKPPQEPQPTLLMRTSPAPAPPGPATVIVAQTVRRNEGSPLSRIKSLNAGDQILALREALDRGADDALLLNNQRKLCCATAGNVFVRIGGAWLT